MRLFQNYDPSMAYDILSISLFSRGKKLGKILNDVF